MMRHTQSTLLKLAAIGFVCIFLSSCATIGRDFSSNVVSQIKIGKTTKGDIELLLGTPWRTGMEDGMKTWTYGYYQYRAFRQTRTKDLVIRFNANNVVASYSFNTDEKDTQY